MNYIFEILLYVLFAILLFVFGKKNIKEDKRSLIRSIGTGIGILLIHLIHDIVWYMIQFLTYDVEVFYVTARVIIAILTIVFSFAGVYFISKIMDMKQRTGVIAAFSVLVLIIVLLFTCVTSKTFWEINVNSDPDTQYVEEYEESDLNTASLIMNISTAICYIPAVAYSAKVLVILSDSNRKKKMK